MNKRICALLIIAVTMMICMPLVNAQPYDTTPDRITAWTDKAKYGPGEKGTIYIAYYNDRTEAVEVKNLTVIYTDWNAYVGNKWVGNETLTISGVTISAKATRVFNDATFTVPSDGRAGKATAEFWIGTDHGYDHDSVDIEFEPTTRSMDQIVMLFTIQIVLLIVCTVIVAGTVFLSARRPQMIWDKEAKPQ